MKKSVQRVFVIVLAAIMVLSVLMPTLSLVAGAEVTQSDIDNIKNDLNDISTQKKEVEEQLEGIQEDKEKAEEQVRLVQERILLTEQEISQSQQLLNEYDQEIAAKEQEITQLEEQEQEQYQEFYAQTRWMEENGTVSYLSILFQVSNFSELLDYMTLITDIMSYNDKIITQLEETQQQISDAKAQVQADRDAQALVQQELEAAKVELDDQKAEATALYNEISAQESEYNEKAKQLAADEAQVQEQLDKAEKEYEEQLKELEQSQNAPNTDVDSGEWYWPLPGKYYISSVFGGRYHPITGVWETHTGADIPASGGTPIHVAQSGVVTTAMYNSSYGYYCIVSHGNGYATLYAHMKTMPIVSVGQTVSKGEVIGYVGTTGSSTGNHLHFELRINGVRANALSLYPNLNFTGL